MFRTVLLSFYFSILVIPFLQGADSKQQLFAILQLADEKKYSEAVEAYQKYLQTAPRSFQGPVLFEIATLQAALGKKEMAFESMDRAVQSGFDDCLSVLQYTEWDALKNDARFKTLYAKMQISESDLKELAWLKAEIENVIHDTKMMITENTNRMDTSFTMIPQSEIPVRQTTSPAVLFHRELLKTMHEVQRYYVMESDKARIEHVGTMGVITGQSSNQAMLESSRLANVAAENRKRAIQQRKFSPFASVGTTLRACSNYE